MASEIRVNQIQSRTGVSTISFTETGPIISGVTTITGDLDVTGLVSYEDVTNIDSVGVVTARNGLRVTGGNLAVGHNNPSVNLHVKGSASNGQIYLGGTGAHSQIYADNDGVLILNADQGNSAANSYLGFNVDNSEKLRITSSGKVGINTASPRAVLDIEGNSENAILMLHSNDANANLQFSDNTGGARILNYGGDLAFRTGTNAHVFGTGDNEALRITSAGVVKVGSNTLITPSTDADNFVIDTGDVDSGLSILSATTGRIYFGDAASTDQGSIRYVHTDDSMRFETNSSEKLRISNLGQLTTKGSNQGNPVGIEIRNNNTNAYSHAELALTSQNATTSKIWCDVPNSGMRLNYNGGSSVKIDQSGNLHMPNGAGIDFSATANSSGSMTSELLDDYEEGTFAPTYLSGLSNPTYSNTSGDYTKIGNLVTFTLRIQATGTNVGSHARIGNLPFTSSVGKREGSATFGYVGNLPGNQEVDIYLHIPGNSTNINFYYTSGAQFFGNGGNGLNGKTLHIRGFYYT